MSTTFHPVDNSALVHLAVHNQWHSNVFRLEAHLTSGVRPAPLQQAAEAVAARLPMLAAGIRKQKNQFVVVPSPERLNIRVDSQPLLYMSMEEIQDCAMRVLYGPQHIAVEFFHSLTDGTGGLFFLKALLAEYFHAPAEEVCLRDAWEDSFPRYATGSPTSLPGGASYLLPAAPPENSPVHRTTLTFPVEELRASAKAKHATLTAYFTALFAQTAMQLQRQEVTPDKPWQPVQIMVPIDLRKWFPSVSLRNFSLYALPKLTLEAANSSFSEIAESMAAQLKAQTAHSRLQAAITTNVELDRRSAALGQMCGPESRIPGLRRPQLLHHRVQPGAGHLSGAGAAESPPPGVSADPARPLPLQLRHRVRWRYAVPDHHPPGQKRRV